VTDVAGSIRQINPKRGTANCVNCAIATDATLAGRPACALTHGPTAIWVLEKEFGSPFIKMSNRQSIDAAMKAAGPGARGVVFGMRPGGIGHVFNVINQRGVVRYVDGQTGTAAGFAGYSDFWLLRTN
jgi:hypothetical protein